MIHSPYEETMARPLFFDVLSGEFRPPSDPEKRVHTLGRLAFAAIVKGTLIQDSDETGDFHYKPSWAPNVLAVTRCLKFPESQAEMIGLSLSSSNQVVRFLDATYEESESSGVVILAQGKTMELPVHLGPEVSLAREAVTQTAQDFFDAVD